MEEHSENYIKIKKNDALKGITSNKVHISILCQLPEFDQRSDKVEHAKTITPCKTDTLKCHKISTC